MEPGLRSDEQLIELCKAGDERAYESLYYRYRGPVVAFAFRILRNHEDALDAFQETFRYIFRKIPGYVPEAKFTTLLYKVARNVCIDIKRKRRVAFDSEMVKDIDAEDGKCVESVERRDLAKAVRTAMNDLPEVYREALDLRMDQGMAYEEIAEIVDCPIGTVKSRIHAALEMLRRRLKERRIL